MEPEYLELSTKLGKLRGLIKKSIGSSKKVYYSFQGIPYAKPPIGDLRFKTSEPYGPWKGILDATKEGNDSIQRHMLFGDIIGDEDCLYLNVFTTQVRQEGSKKAVMVWIHGGGFGSGSGSSELYGPDFLIEEDVVYVSINYRLGALGFLYFENETVQGNAGLRDQVLALRWVRDNISSFGGDPDNITIFGESAGAAGVNYHLISPLSEGLFHKAILQSGSSMCPWALQTNPREKALLLASQLGCTSQDDETVLQFLKSVPAVDIVNVQDNDELKNGKEATQLTRVFVPCVEVNGTSAFLPDSPRRLMEKGQIYKVPVITGILDQEGLLAISSKRINCDRVNADMSTLVPLDVGISRSTEEEKALGREILQFYTDTDTLSWDIDVIKRYLDYVTDKGFAVGAEHTRQLLLKHLNTPIFSYLITYCSPRGLSHTLIPRAYPDIGHHFVGLGACHGDELVHQFKTNSSEIPYLPPSAEDQVFMSKLLKAWTTFAKTGNPNCQELGITWAPDDLQNPHFLEMGKVWRLVKGSVFPERMGFWKNIYQKY